MKYKRDYITANCIVDLTEYINDCYSDWRVINVFRDRSAERYITYVAILEREVKE